MMTTKTERRASECKSWSKKEEQYLRDNLVDWNVSEVATDLNRTERAVKNRAQKIGVHRKYVPPTPTNGGNSRINAYYNGQMFQSNLIKVKEDYVEFMSFVYHSIRPALLRERKIVFEIEMGK